MAPSDFGRAVTMDFSSFPAMSNGFLVFHLWEENRLIFIFGPLFPPCAALAGMGDTQRLGKTEGTTWLGRSLEKLRDGKRGGTHGGGGGATQSDFLLQVSTRLECLSSGSWS